MLLRNGKDVQFLKSLPKINQKKLLNFSAQNLPSELLSIITDFHHCSHCYNNKQVHCNFCNRCNINKHNHLYCDICKVCFPKYITRTFQNRCYNNTLNLHIHCEVCDNIKDYNMYQMLYKCKTCT